VGGKACHTVILTKLDIRSICSVTNPSVIIEKDSNTLVTELEPKPVLITVINPFSDEHRRVLAGSEKTLPGWHHRQSRADSLLQGRGPGPRPNLLG